jgi:DHA1 family bicyclomycin/chloramphenicol resistance-like MFS transporter
MAGKKSISQLAVAAIILIIVLITRMGGDIFIPSIPRITEEFNIDKFQAAVNINLYSITLALSFAFLGPLTDLIRKRTLLLTGGIACFISYLVCGLAVNIQMINAGRLILAIGSGLIILTSQTWIGDRSGKKDLLGRLAWFSLIVALAPMLAPVLGGFITDHFSWRWNFWLMLILSALAILVIFTIKSSKQDQPAEKAVFNPVKLLKTYSGVILNSPLIRLSLVIFTLFMLQGAFLTFSSFLLMDDMGLTASEFGLLSIFFVGGMLVGRFPTMYLEKKFSIRFVMIMNILVVAVSLIGSLLFFYFEKKHTVLEIMIFMTLMRLGFSGLAVLGIRNSMVLKPEQKGTFAGLYSFMNHLSGWFGIMLTQIFYRFDLLSISIYNLFLAISLIFIAIGTLLFLRAYPGIRNLLENNPAVTE